MFGVSKASADLLVQEYGKNFLLKTGIFRGGCITGPNHSGAELHGFLNYLVKANINKLKYFIYGYKGKQVRDNIHSSDLINSFWQFYKKPSCGEVFNIGGVGEISILDLAGLILERTGSKSEIVFRDYDNVYAVGYEDMARRVPDISKVTSFTGWVPKLSINHIIDDVVKSYS